MYTPLADGDLDAFGSSMSITVRFAVKEKRRKVRLFAERKTCTRLFPQSVGNKASARWNTEKLSCLAEKTQHGEVQAFRQGKNNQHCVQATCQNRRELKEKTGEEQGFPYLKPVSWRDTVQHIFRTVWICWNFPHIHRTRRACTPLASDCSTSADTSPCRAQDPLVDCTGTLQTATKEH